MEARIYQLVYHLSRHYLLGWTLNRWTILGLLISPFVLLLIPFQSPLWPWLLFGLLLFFNLSSIIGVWWIRRRGFLRFEPEALESDIAPTPLPFPDKIPLNASGNFAVESMIRSFVEERGHYQAFKTRERVIMVPMPHTRYVLLALSSETEIGWWYIFFKPNMIKHYEPGRLCFGPHMRPALRLTYLPEDRETPETIYLSFDTLAHRNQMLADLLTDQILETAA